MKARIWSEVYDTRTFYSRPMRIWRYVVPLPRGGASTGGANNWDVAMQRVQATIDARWAS